MDSLAGRKLPPQNRDMESELPERALCRSSGEQLRAGLLVPCFLFVFWGD